MDDLTERLAEALAVCEAATEGPWEWKRRKIGAPEEIVGVLKTSPLLWPDEPDAAFIAASRTGYPAALRALQAVMGLHKREVRTARMTYYCGHCGDAAGWPCPTIRAITEHLDATP